jgi:hypothetical protein
MECNFKNDFRIKKNIDFAKVFVLVTSGEFKKDEQKHIIYKLNDSDWWAKDLLLSPRQ